MILLLGFILSLGSVARGQPGGDTWRDLPEGNFDRTLLSARDKRLLDESRFGWQHAETQHFVLHFERKDFAQRVGRMAEFFYQYISDDLKGLSDRAPGKSHIFIFRNSRQWDRFMEVAEVGALEWAFSMVAGTSMYLQQAGSTSQSGEVLGHEMTHMVFNRFLPGRIPLWLNEGLAEWYGEFAYSAMKGVGKSSRSVFRGFRDHTPLPELLSAKMYPSDRREISRFYRSSQFLVGYLLLEFPHEQMVGLLMDASSGKPATEALLARYGFASVEELDRAFRRFLR
ncbi:MAG TPA: hypothetical protein PKE55_07945 [Kiritimatiellia bacterium]|nr:hypothetical protein [Kiritimatiellia bacterium]